MQSDFLNPEWSKSKKLSGVKVVETVESSGALRQIPASQCKCLYHGIFRLFDFNKCVILVDLNQFLSFTPESLEISIVGLELQSTFQQSQCLCIVL